MQPDPTSAAGKDKRYHHTPSSPGFAARTYLAVAAIGLVCVLLAVGLGEMIRANHARFVLYSGALVYASSATTLYALKATDGAIWWQHPLSDLGGFVTLADGDVLAEAGDMLVAISATDGDVRWQLGPADDTTYQPLINAGNVVYVAVTQSTSLLAHVTGAVLALRARDGHALWQVALAHGVALQAYLTGATLYAGELDQNDAGVATLYALDAQSGVARWHADVPGGESILPMQGDADTIYASIGDHDFAAFAASDGALRWRLPQMANTVPIVANGSVYVCAAGVVTAQKARDLTPQWQTNVVGASTIFPLDDGLIGVFMTNGFVVLDAATGTPRWRSPPAQNFEPPLRAGAILYVNAAPDAYALNLADGTPRWHMLGTGGTGAAPILVGNTLYLAMGDMIYALDARTGAIQWQHTIPNRSATPLGVGKD